MAKNILKYLGIGLVVLVAAIGVLMVVSLALPDGWKLTPEILVTLAAAALSFSLARIPSWRAEFAALSVEAKVGINIGLVVLLAVFMYVGTCTGWLIIPGIVCSVVGIKTLALYIFLAAGGNQLTYIATPEASDVTAAKATRAS